MTTSSKTNKEMKTYSRATTREQLSDIIIEGVKFAFKRGYQKGYRAGRRFDAVDKAMKKATNEWHKREQTGLETK